MDDDKTIIPTTEFAIITEQGDLGLGYSRLKEEDIKTLEQFKKKKHDNNDTKQ